MDKINQQAFDMRTILVLEIFGKPNTKELLETKKIMIDILVISQNVFCGDWKKKKGYSNIQRLFKPRLLTCIVIYIWNKHIWLDVD